MVGWLVCLLAGWFVFCLSLFVCSYSAMMSWFHRHLEANVQSVKSWNLYMHA